MALNNEILAGVFNKRPPKKSLKEELDGLSATSTVEIPKPARHTVYDKPEEKNENLGQTQDKSRTINSVKKELKGFAVLVGVQRSIVIFIYESCKTLRTKVTEPVTIQYLASSCQTTKLSAQKSVQRLELKGLLKRESFKAGRGGWTKYALDDAVYQEVMLEESQGKLRTNLGQGMVVQSIVNKREEKKAVNNILSQEKNTPDMQPEWLAVNITPLDSIGFSKYHLNQLCKHGNLTPESVQQSIDYFAFDLEQNNKRTQIKGSPINYFMGILKRTGIYTAPVNFETPQEMALKKMLEFERNREQKLNEMLKELRNAKFRNWMNSLSDKELVRIAPKTKGKNREKLSGLVMGELYGKFEQEVWPELEQEIALERKKLEG